MKQAMSTKPYSDGSSSFDGDTPTPVEVRALLIEELQKVHIELRSAKMALASACTEAAAHKVVFSQESFRTCAVGSTN
jgi:hypothetical protein